MTPTTASFQIVDDFRHRTVSMPKFKSTVNRLVMVVTDRLQGFNFPQVFFFSYDFKHFIMRFVENRIDKFLSMVIKYSSSIHHHTPALTAKKYFSLTRDVSIVYFL